VDLATSERLIARARKLGAPGKIFVAESGIHTTADVDRLARAGANAMLVGESLMREKDPSAKIHELLAS
jgi:indole-3-glycerol phosphate synthase